VHPVVAMHRLSRGELRGISEGDVLRGFFAVAVLELTFSQSIQQDQAVGVEVDAGLRRAALVDPGTGTQPLSGYQHLRAFVDVLRTITVDCKPV
jgi:hypothetical protein